MRSSMLCALALAVTSTATLAQTTTTTTTTREISPAPVEHVTSQTTHTTTEHVVTETVKEISAGDRMQIVANVLCQNVPPVQDPVAAVNVYSNYIDQVSQLFANNSQNMTSNTIGINNDHQMSYTLYSPVNIVGIDFTTVNINKLKDQNGSYHQITASKPLTASDQGSLSGIPQNDNLTVSTANQKLEIICNVKVPMVEK
ncbi:hypothetical protein [Entomomonas asaccharolytica]|uniref:Uncharacterized protein n=1 Tax=Entomomonas asaccharolytica TaxID=2785331 RepID=A0A974RVW6_9GAMM|nr:hypothetical protein [Entomomonas asaccharolytica]QQP84606.1 hypothetical protein JHT90_09300 [Entomomonas asaccharolytica]